MKNIIYYLEYILLLFLENFFYILPRKTSLSIGAAIGKILYFFGFYKKIVNKNLDFIGIFNKEEKNKIIKKLYINICKYAVDFLIINKKEIPFSIENIHIVNSLLEKNNGLIAVLAHFGNWELLANIFGKKYNELNVIAAKMKNPYIDKWLLKKRLKTNVNLIYKENALKKMLSILKQNGIVAILIDQYAGKEGTDVPFLGKHTKTYQTVGALMYKTNCSAVLPYAILLEDDSYKVIINEFPLINISKQDKNNYIYYIQKAHNEIISEWILKYPQHYFGWFHKRFKESILY
jgi:KDO2-lipid IV(A) lauroyltransferase